MRVRSRRSLRSGAEVWALDPHAVQDDGDLAGQGDDGAPAALGLHQFDALGLQAGPGDRAHQHGVGRCVERGANAGVGDAAGTVLFARLKAPRP